MALYLQQFDTVWAQNEFLCKNRESPRSLLGLGQGTSFSFCLVVVCFRKGFVPLVPLWFIFTLQ
jgi:hypothetical protein